MAAGGYGCVLVTTSPPDEDDLTGFLGLMANLTEKPLADYDAEWRPLPQTMEDYPATTAEVSASTADMVLVPGGLYSFHVVGNMIEGTAACVGFRHLGTVSDWSIEMSLRHQSD